MKRSSYMMIGAYVVGLLLTLGFASSVIFDEDNRKPVVEFGGEPVETQLESFDAINLSGVTLHSRNFSLSGIKGIRASVSDTVSSPRIVMLSDWEKIVDYEVKDGCLDVNIDVKRIEGLDTMRRNMVITDTYCPVEIVVPAGMLSMVENAENTTLYVDGMNTDKLTVKSEGRIVLINCEIDTVIGSGKSFSELKLDDTRIKFAEITAPNTFTVNPVNDSSYIDVIQLRKW